MSSQEKSHSKWHRARLTFYRRAMSLLRGQDSLLPANSNGTRSQLINCAAQVFPCQFRESWIRNLRETLQTDANSILLEMRMVWKHRAPRLSGARLLETELNSNILEADGKNWK